MKHRRHCLALFYRLLIALVLTFITAWPLAGSPTSLGAAPPNGPPTPIPAVSPACRPPQPGLSACGFIPFSSEDVRSKAEHARAGQAMETALAEYQH